MVKRLEAWLRNIIRSEVSRPVEGLHIFVEQEFTNLEKEVVRIFAEHMDAITKLMLNQLEAVKRDLLIVVRALEEFHMEGANVPHTKIDEVHQSIVRAWPEAMPRLVEAAKQLTINKGIANA